MEAVIQKGSRVRAEWLSAEFGKTGLTGTQLKTTATGRSIIGTVRHIRSNDPSFKPENCVIFVEPNDGSGKLCDKCGVNEIQIKTSWICEVISL